MLDQERIERCYCSVQAGKLQLKVSTVIGILEAPCRFDQCRRVPHLDHFSQIRPGAIIALRRLIKSRPGANASLHGGFQYRIPAITDFRARGTIIGPAGLTAVFGMGTGVAPLVWSPEKCPTGGQARPGTNPRLGRTHEAEHT